ncbi:hypothetical protein RHMOL_Rhmol09G0185400 [Rhododendron molle]|uniref:Uncharacterized protein n=1 Tax=Rhododendron molle TaxID=49168 RepID=A0ACC0MEU6_RHOML|nr:hypothetical protein RHMOL_Rhmol09G0185400 [Rhododendron molle]
MAESPENHHRDIDRDLGRGSSSSSSSEVSVDVELEIKEAEDDGADRSGAAAAIADSLTCSQTGTGLIDRNVPSENVVPFESSTAAKSESASSQLTKTRGRGRKKTFDVLAAKIVDEKVPIKRKVKWLKRLATVKDDGTVQLEVPGDIKPVSLDFGSGVRCNGATGEESVDATDIQDLPPLQIVMLIVGTRGDVQPFVAIGKRLQEYGHRVRLATHSNFEEFVLAAGLEFFALGGDPKVLAGYMVKNKGFLPSEPSEIPNQRRQIKDIIFSLLPACTEPDPVTNVAFKADAIISNPPAYDWGPKIDVVGFCFLDLASNYAPPDSLVKWLKRGRAPIYIGFGSLPVQEPAKMTQIIVEALELTGQRGIINKGWGGLGNLAEPKDFVYLLDNCPHDWLFLRCAAVVHHGGAGTTAAGLKAACPTTVVPFFGDQPFWGERVHARGLGPAPIPIEEFSREKLIKAIHFMQDPTVKQRAVEMAEAMEHEDGVTGAVKAFYKQFPRDRLTEAYRDSNQLPPPQSGSFSIRRCFGWS